MVHVPFGRRVTLPVVAQVFQGEFLVRAGRGDTAGFGSSGGRVLEGRKCFWGAGVHAKVFLVFCGAFGPNIFSVGALCLLFVLDLWAVWSASCYGFRCWWVGWVCCVL